MCVLWFLLQLVVSFLYWDLPPQERGKAAESAPCCRTEAEERKRREEDDEEDEEDEEEKPLMASQELGGSYGSVVSPNTNHASSPSSTPQDTEAPSSPGFFSARGV